MCNCLHVVNVSLQISRDLQHHTLEQDYLIFIKFHYFHLLGKKTIDLHEIQHDVSEIVVSTCGIYSSTQNAGRHNITVIASYQTAAWHLLKILYAFSTLIEQNLK